MRESTPASLGRKRFNKESPVLIKAFGQIGEAAGDCHAPAETPPRTTLKNWPAIGAAASAMAAAAAAKSLQSCRTLCDPIDGSPPGSPIPGILQARTLEWVAISFSNA